MGYVTDISTSTLSDPQSAQIHITRAMKYEGYPATYVCGKVNAKNKFGGYTGAQTFYAKIINNNLEDFVTRESIGDDYGKLGVFMDCN